MKRISQISDGFFMNKYTIVYVFITSILSYFILNHIFKSQDIYIPLIFRIYYIILSIVLFVLINQVRKINEQYVDKEIVIFFSLMIFISILGFMIDVNQEDFFIQYKIYIDFSKESILFVETFSGYALSEHYLRGRKLEKVSYSILLFAFGSMIIIYYSKVIVTFAPIIYFVIDLALLIKMILNIKKSINLKEQKINSIKTYICSTIIILLTNLYGFYIKNEEINMLIETLYLINFRITWNIVMIEIVREPYSTLSNSLSEKNKELDRLNYAIEVRNKELEKSISLLKSKENLYSTFLRFMPHPVVILNSDNNRIIFVNNQFLKFADIPQKREIINKKINRYIEFIPNNMEDKDYNAVFRIGETIKYIKINFLPTYEDSRRKLMLIKDNTSKVQIEEIKKEVENKKLEERMRTEFLSSISHDLKTPINVIYSAMQVEKIYIHKKDLEILSKYNNISKQNCISLIKLTNNLIDNSQINSHYLVPRLEKINIIEVIEDNVMSLVDYVKWHNVELIFDTNTEESYLNIDQEFMDRIILNLVSNAVKFTPIDGKIYVIVEDICNKVNILVKDNGTGIEEEFVYHAFNRYSVGQNCKSDYKSGTGIGLSVVKQLVELQGGTIEIKRNEDIGTTISMEFKKENKYA